MATFTGTAGNDSYNGGSANDVISGNDGDDLLSGLGGADIITGGNGGDTIDGGAGNDNLRGNAGNDSMHGGLNNDMIYGDGGDDTLVGGDGNDFIEGGAGDDILLGGNGDDTLYYGGDGADTLEGGAGFDTLTINLVSAQLTAAVRADLVALSNWMENPDGELMLSDLGITVSGFEFLNLLVDGVSIDIASLTNSAPSAEAQVSLMLVEDGSVSGQAAAIDPDGGVLTWSLLEGPKYGNLDFNPANGAYTYTGAYNYGGKDSFIIRITDDIGLTTDQVVDVTVTAVADAPTLAVSSASVTLDSTVTGTTADDFMDAGIGNDVINGGDGNDVIRADSVSVMRNVPLDIAAALTDADGSETLWIRVSGVPQDSSLSAGALNADGSWSLTSEDLIGLSMITSATKDFLLAIEATSTEVSGDAITVTASIPVTFSTATGNDTIDGGYGDDTIDAGWGDDVIVHRVGGGFDAIAGGDGVDTVALALTNADLTMAARADLINLASYLALHNEADVVTFASLGMSLQAIEKVAITLDGALVDLASLLNAAPTAEAVVNVVAIEDTPYAGSVVATDANGDSLVWSVVAGPEHGSLMLDEATGAYVYTAAANYSGTDSFLVGVSDSSGETVQQSIDVTVVASADQPMLSVGVLAASVGAMAASLNGTSASDTLIGTNGHDVIQSGEGNDLVYGDGSSANSSITLDITAALTDLDGSEQLSIRISGLPAGAALSAGQANADGSWSLLSSDLAGLQMTAPAGSGFTVNVAATATEQSGVSATVTAALPVAFGIGNGAGNDTIRGGAGNDTVYGGDGNDVIEGSSGDDVLFDGAGDDLLRGGAGNDLIVAGFGDDIYRGGRGFDTLDLSASKTGLVIDAGKHSVDGGLHAEIYGFESIIGSQKADIFIGTMGDEVFNASAGNDTIRGRGGNDTLTGGAGRDTFTWTKQDVLHGNGRDSGLDIITDFGFGDRLDLQDLLTGLKGKSVTDFVKVKDNGWGTLLSVKLDGKFVEVARLEGFHDNSVAHMIAQDMILA